MGKNKKVTRLFILLAVAFLVVISAIGVLSNNKFLSAKETFLADGYILIPSDESDDTLHSQCFFLSGSSYMQNYDHTISFTDVNSNKVNIDSKNFIHYTDNSLASLSDTVLLDTDELVGEQVSYYAISAKNVLSRSGADGYQTDNAGEKINFSNFIWKISSSRYMAVSKKIKLVVSETSQQVFDNYIEIEYVDEGVVHLVNQDGTYSSISSDAYLELENGIRIYLGSKNVSDGENILVNMTQMVISSDDDVEIIPDEDYTIEVDKQPRIIVNASDGESGENGVDAEEGKAGKSGDPGALGNQGAAGQPGTAGDDGDDGTSAVNADLEYREQNMPLFFLDDNGLDVTSNSVNGYIYYLNDQNCSIDYAVFKIIDTNDDSLIWSSRVEGNLLKAYNKVTKTGNPLTGDINNAVTGLKQNTQYALTVDCQYYPTYTYVDPNGVSHISNLGYSINQQLFSKLFTTDGLGLNLAYDSATTETINANLAINKVTYEKIAVKLYDEDKNEMKLNDNVQEYVFDINSSNKTLLNPEFVDGEDLLNGIMDLKSNETDLIGTVASLQYSGLDSNTVYYLRVVNAEDGTTEYDYIKVKTLKIEAELGKPSVYYSPQTDQFVLEPCNYSDPDGGINYFEYNILDETGDVVYTLTSESLDTKRIDVSDNLNYGVNYKLQIVAYFNNNEVIKEIRSEMSDPFNASSTWPTVSFSDEIRTPTTLSGTVTIHDGFHMINGAKQTADNSSITIKLKSKNAVVQHYTSESNYEYSSEGVSKVIEQEITVKIGMDSTAWKNCNYEDGRYEIYYAFKGLKENTQYEITVYADKMSEEGVEIHSATPLLIGTSEIYKTRSYSETPVYIDCVTASGENSESYFFNLNVFLSLNNSGYEKEYQKSKDEEFSPYAKKIFGVDSTSELVIKSISALKFDIYESAKNLTGKSFLPNMNAKLNSASLSTTELITNRITYTGYDYISNYEFVNEFYPYTKIIEKQVDMQTVKEEKTVGVYYRYLTEENGDLKRDGDNNVVVEELPNGQYLLTINSSSFGPDTSDKISAFYKRIAANNPTDKNWPIFIRVTAAYDYTYSTEVKGMYDNSNMIQIGATSILNQTANVPLYGGTQTSEFKKGEYYVADDTERLDTWIQTNVKAAKPGWRDSGGISLEPIYQTSTDLPAYIAGEFEDHSIAGSNFYDINYSNSEVYMKMGVNTDDLGDLNTVGEDLLEHWDDINLGDETVVGYKITGNSTWLGAFASAVRYKVYNSKNELIATSFYPGTDTNHLGFAEGWIPCENSELDSWAFFFDVERNAVDEEDKLNTREIVRGDYFYVVMEVKLKDYDNEIYPTVGSEKVIKVGAQTYKQQPEVRFAEYKGSTTDNSINDIFYAYIDDPDKALEYVDDKLRLYTLDDKDAEVDVEVVDMSNIDIDKDGETDKQYYSIKLKAVDNPDVSDILRTDYDQINELGKENANTILLTSEEFINKHENVKIEAIATDYDAFYVVKNEDKNYYDAVLQIKTSAASIYDAIKQINLTVVNKETSVNKYKTFTINNFDTSSKNGITTEKQTSGGEIVGYIVHYHIPFEQFTDITTYTDSGINQFYIYADVYYDSGNYGISYADIANYPLTAAFNMKNDGINVKLDMEFDVDDDFVAAYNTMTNEQKQAWFAGKITSKSMVITNLEYAPDSHTVNTFDLVVDTLSSGSETLNMKLDSENKKVTLTAVTGVLYKDAQMYGPTGYHLGDFDRTDFEVKLTVNGNEYAIDTNNTRNYINYRPDYSGETDGSSSDIKEMSEVTFVKDDDFFTVGTTKHYFAARGLKIMPKETKKLGRVSVNSGIDIDRIESYADVDIETGMYFAKLEVTLTSIGTVDTSKGLRIGYRPVGETDYIYTSDADVLKIENGTNTYTVNWKNRNFDGLNPNTSYEFVVEGFYRYFNNTKGEIVEEWLPINIKNHGPASITYATSMIKKTLDIISINDTDAAKYPSSIAVSYATTSPTRDTKYVDFKLSMDAYLKDIKAGIASITFELYNINDYDTVNSKAKEGKTALDVIEYKSDAGEGERDIENSFVDTLTLANSAETPDDSEKLTYYSKQRFNFAPDEEHIVDGNTTYLAVMRINYQKKSGEQIYEIDLTKPKKFTSTVSWRVTNVVYSEKIDESNVNHKIQFKINGTDSKRLLTSNTTGTDYNPKAVTYAVELYKVVDNKTVGPLTFKYGGKSVNYIVKTVQTSGSSTSLQQFAPMIEYLDGNTEYFIKVYYQEDLTNSGLVFEFDPSDKSGLKSFESTHAVTASGVDISNIQLTMLPEYGFVNVTGNNLNNVDGIYYELTDTTDSSSPVTYKSNETEVAPTKVRNSVGDLNNTDLWNKQSTEGVFSLYIPQLNDTTKSYELVVYLYDGEKYVAASTSITITVPAPKAARFNSYLSNLLSGE